MAPQSSPFEFMKIKIFFTIAVMALLASCRSNRDMVYFQDIDNNSEVLDSLYRNYSVKVKPADELLITVWSEVAEATLIYNLPQVSFAEVGDDAVAVNQKILSYVVDNEGFINFPLVGKLKVEGLTTGEVSELLTKEISKDVKDPYVRVQLAKFRVNVMGEVARPGMQEVKTERYSILDALGAAGDLTQYGRRNDVLLIREENGNRTYHRLDLTSADLLSSPYFYLQQNDVVYVAPNDIRQSNAEYNQNNSYKVQVISTAISAVSVIASLIIALVL